MRARYRLTIGAVILLIFFGTTLFPAAEGLIRSQPVTSDLTWESASFLTSGQFPHALDATTNRMFLTTFTGCGPDVVNTLTNTLLPWPGQCIERGFQGIEGVAVDEGRRRLYAVSRQQSTPEFGVLHIIDVDSLTMVETLSLGECLVRFPIVNPATGDLFVSCGGFRPMVVFDPSRNSSDPLRVQTLLALGSYLDAPVINPATNLMYVPESRHFGVNDAVRIVDVDPSHVAYGAVVGTVSVFGAVTLDVMSQRLYGSSGGSCNPTAAQAWRVLVVDVDGTKSTFHTVIDEIAMPDLASYSPPPGSAFPVALRVNAARQRLYVVTSDTDARCDSGMGNNRLLAVNLANNGIESSLPWFGSSFFANPSLTLSPVVDRLYVIGQGNPMAARDLQPQSISVTDTSVQSVSVGTTTLTFGDITAGGETTVEVIDPASANLQLPGQFAIQGAAAFDISTTMTFTGSVQVCFNMVAVTDPDAFATLTILHGENGNWVPYSTTRDLGTGLVCALVPSLSPFVVARLTTLHHVQALFDADKAFKAGSTIPVKIRIVNESGLNVSSADLIVNAKRVRRDSPSSVFTVQDAGRANPDRNFRYDAGIAGYVYNLNTKGLVAGTYSLIFTAAGDKTYHSVSFQLR